MSKTYIFGHKNPDTDAVTAAISLSYLKNKTGMDTEPRILGNVNKETSFVLNHWNFDTPEILEDVKVQIKDIAYNDKLMMHESESIYEAYTYMVENGITGLPIVNSRNKFMGYVSLKEIATDFIKGEFDNLNASYENIKKVLQAQEILKFDDEIKGKIMAATYSSELFISTADVTSDTIVIVGSRKHVIDFCINCKAKMIILIGGQELSQSELEAAQKNKVNVIITPKKSFEVAKLIGLSNYIRTILRNETPVTFTPEDYLTDFFEISNKLKHSNYPIVDAKNKCRGLMRLMDVNHYERKHVILVDHNDIKQSVQGLNEATIIEIIDHHALGNLTTANPISFRNMSVGSSNTIIYHLYKEARVEIPKNIAGLMLSGILSDTLILKSPTTTEIDIHVVEELSKIAEVDYKEYGMQMLKAGSSIDGLSIEDIVFYDYKEFQANDMGFGIGQILTLDYAQILEKKDEYIDFLNKTCSIKGFKMMALFITDIVNEGSYVLFSSGAKQIMSLAYNRDVEEGTYLEGIISRKNQIVPNIIGEFENMD